MQSLTLLINLLRAVASARRDSAPLVLLPPRDLLQVILGEQMPAALSNTTLQLLERVTEGFVPASQIIPEVYQLAQQLEKAIVGDAVRATKLQAYGQALQTLVALNEAADRGDGALSHVSLHLDRAVLVNLLQEWYLQTTSDEPDVIVVCQVHGASADYTVRPRGRHFLQRRVALNYQVGRLQPLVQVRAVSVAPEQDEPVIRHEWLQFPFPDYDLAIYTEQERYVGRILTRVAELPIVVRSNRLSITIAFAESERFLVTDILNEQGRPLTRLLRWPPPPTLI